MYHLRILAHDAVWYRPWPRIPELYDTLMLGGRYTVDAVEHEAGTEAGNRWDVTVRVRRLPDPLAGTS
jgi:hypothetical protein